MNKKPDNPDSLRIAAEKKLAHLASHEQKPRPAEELLHEFQVHQIELDMQNEQLRQAQLALEESRDRYVDLYEFAPVGYLTLTRAGIINEINLTGAMLFGAERKKLLLRRFESFVMPEQRDRWNRLFAGTLQHSEASNCELALVKADGTHFHAHLDCLCQTTKSGPPMMRIALADITRTSRAEEALHEWQQFVEYASWGMAIGDVANRTIKRVNPAFAKMHGYAMEEMLGMKSVDLFAPENRVDFTNYYESMLKAGYHAFETVRLRKDGSTFPAIIDASVVTGFDGAANYIISVKDVSERKANERQMRELTAHLQTVREEEKASIAREIHDDLGGTLTALKMEAYYLADELSAHKEMAPLLKHVELVAQLTDNATSVMRQIITGLRPSILDDLGLAAALEWQAAQFQKRSGIECRVSCIIDENCEKCLDGERSINLFRIFQEALTNIIRHSFASKVEVDFHLGSEEIFLSINDNGRGMPENRVYSSTSYGILGMTERVEQLGGTIKFGSMPGGGFSVSVSLPSAGNIQEGKHDTYPDRRRPRHRTPGINAHPGKER